ncbi:hypothetical protein [Candidatus Albibeggiatoa sp. nov. BB20]|uniref:hypothetical protein n=1 Tax=Candidatus Albibeggiatoa sp. nov. BB20 TaxID=3162723 RepID=UPI003365946E
MILLFAFLDQLINGKAYAQERRDEIDKLEELRREQNRDADAVYWEYLQSTDKDKFK